MWNNSWGELSLEAVQSRYSPPEEYRVALKNYEPNTVFSGTMREGKIYMLMGTCQYKFKDSIVELSASQILAHDGGTYEFSVLGAEKCEFVSVWAIGEIMRRDRLNN